MNTNKRAKIFRGFKVTAEGRVFVSDLVLLQDVQRELDRKPSLSAGAVGASMAESRYSTAF